MELPEPGEMTRWKAWTVTRDMDGQQVTFERAGGRYYPKLQACVPFTPATGPRLLELGRRDRRRPQSLRTSA